MEKNIIVFNETLVPINLYPEFKSEMADEGLYGMVAEIIKTLDNNWHYIKTSYDYCGYVNGKNVIIDNKRVEDWILDSQYLINHGIVDVMPEPSYKGYVKKVLTRGARIINNKNEENGWTEIKLADGQRGWIRSKFIEERKKDYNIKDETNIRENLVKTAMTYLGTQYRWGGKSPLGLDCSGLCSMSYMLNGIIIYRDAIRKDEYMKKIKLSEIKKGDLLFFPGHVAMYISNNKYIHSSASINGVGINSLNPEDEDYNEYLANNIIDIGSIF